MKTRKLLLLTCLILVCSVTLAQVNILWQTRYTSSGSKPDRAEDLVIDSQGNVYVTGIGWGASATFDFVTVKYDSAGNQLWRREYNGVGNGFDHAHAIAVDAGFVYVTGYSDGNAGAATDNNYATIKYNKHTGIAVWTSAAIYNGTLSGGTDEAFDIAVDAAGNVYVTGTSDSPISSVKVNSAATTIKYNSLGIQQWSARYEGAGGGLDAAYSLVVEPVTGTVYVAGSNDVGINPAININYLTLKYNTSGALQWISSYNGPDSKYDEARAIDIDAAGNVYITGYSQKAVVTNSDIATIKYSTTGVQQWVQRYNGTGDDFDKANAIKLDASGNVYITGRSVGVSPAAEDIITIKYTTTGIQKWVARYNHGGVTPYDEGKALALDTKGNVYVTGYSYTGANKNDYTTLKYDSVGIQKWVTHYDGTGNGTSDQAAAIAIDNGGNVFITGLSGGAGSAEDYETIKYCQLAANAGKDTTICIGKSVALDASLAGAVSYSWFPNNGSLSSTYIANPVATPTTTTSYIVTITNAIGCVDVDTVVIRVGQYPSAIITPNGPTSFCIGNSVVLMVDSTANYLWNTPTNNTTQSITVNTSGIYSVTVTNHFGCSATGSYPVVVNTPNINAGNNDTICLNTTTNLQATGGLLFSWHPGNTLNDSSIANPVASPLVTTTYTVLASDINGCSDTDSVTVVVRPLPAIPLIVAGGIYTLSCVATYASYQWYLNGVLIPGATNQLYVYNQNGNYSIEVTDVYGCSVSSASIVVSDYVGIEELENLAFFSIYPNPVSTYITIDLEILKKSDIQIVLSSITNQQLYIEQIKQGLGNYKTIINVEEQAAGIYYLQIQVDNKMVTKKIVKY